MSERHFLCLLRLVLGGVFIYASWDKLLHPADFAEIIRSYRILPAVLVNPAAIVLPWLELVLGVLLVANRWADGALLLADLLLVTFWSALAFNYARGLNVHCGCFSTKAVAEGDMGWYLIRDGAFVLMGLAAMVLLLRAARSSPQPDSAPAGALTA
jgi:uncharacterized membrane protein YphA (DoxX/SURF4 family)